MSLVYPIGRGDQTQASRVAAENSTTDALRRRESSSE